MILDIDKKQLWDLALSVQCFISALEDELNNKAPHLLDHKGELQQKYVESHNKKIWELRALRDKIYYSHKHLQEVK